MISQLYLNDFSSNESSHNQTANLAGAGSHQSTSIHRQNSSSSSAAAMTMSLQQHNNSNPHHNNIHQQQQQQIL